jgi:hypothetical protein
LLPCTAGATTADLTVATSVSAPVEQTGSSRQSWRRLLQRAGAHLGRAASAAKTSSGRRSS